ncbi:S-layer homology domain-containing protein [Chamaesiphon polymorphus]|uniref:S-layer homology domain-containing protein n=1 Tax=Chamaesiphon polymorphus TaxID=2107691 RepID=UPI0015E7BB5E|nr:S-layer homology domain-containing protein [Chamaesiphon polymorphus]
MSRSHPNWRPAQPRLALAQLGSGISHARKRLLLRCLTISLLFIASGCNAGTSFQNPFAPDPKLKEPLTVGPNPSPTPATSSPNALPADFPVYPQAKLQSTTQTPDLGTVTTWTTADPIDFVYKFYQQELTAKQWEIVTQPSDSNPILAAKQAQINVSIEPQTSSDKQQTGVTTYTISLRGATDAATTTPTPTPTATTPTSTTSPLPTTKPIAKLPTSTTDYVKDLTQIGVLTSAESAPNRIVTRREYARWLVAAHNRITGSKPTQQVKLATTDTNPAFQDVPSTNPDFPSIQGLAEAGLIPSPLSGDATSVLFRPDTPLTREQMILWKVPLDTRQPLPTASLDAVKQTWGFQDAGKIDPKAMRAVLADFQNGDRSNIRRAFGYTTLFQPKKTVTVGEVATTLWYFGANSEGLSARDAVQTEQ